MGKIVGRVFPVVDPPAPFVCEHCGAEFKTGEDIQAHILAEHLLEKEPAEKK